MGDGRALLFATSTTKAKDQEAGEQARQPQLARSGTRGIAHRVHQNIAVTLLQYRLPPATGDGNLGTLGDIATRSRE